MTALPWLSLVLQKRDKKHKYSQACQNCRATFTHLCVSVDGMLGCESTAFLKQNGDMLSAKWEIDYGVVNGNGMGSC